MFNQQCSKYKKKYGNYITTAESVWRSIINPFTLDDIESLANEKNYNESVEKLRKLGWSPKIDLKTGIQNTIEYFESSKND